MHLFTMNIIFANHTITQMSTYSLLTVTNQTQHEVGQNVLNRKKIHHGP